MTTVDYFLLLDGIPGDSHDPGHRDQIEVEGFSWGETLTTTIGHAGGSGAGKVSMTPLLVRAGTCSATPHLLVACASGRHLAEARLTGRSLGGKGAVDFLVITLKQVLVSALKVGTEQPGQRPVDEISLTFEDITITVRTQRPDGSAGDPQTAEWNLRSHTGHE